MDNDLKKNKKSGFISLIISILGAAIGVQHSRRHEDDFSQKSPLPFIIAGVVFTALFVISLIVIARFALRHL